MEILCLGVYAVSLAVVMTVLVLSCRSDFMTMTIPNRYPAVLIAAFIPAYIADRAGGLGVFQDGYDHIAAFGGVLVITFILYAIRVWGAGDSKLAIAIALWIGMAGSAMFFLVMAVSGLLLVLLSFVFQKTGAPRATAQESWLFRIRNGERVLPYGIAIAMGGAVSMVSLGYFNLLSLIQSVG